MKKLMLMLLAALLACAPALAEDVDWDFMDVGVVTFNEVPWNFPVAVADMDPALIRLANKEYLLPKSFVPDDLVTMKRLKLDKNGSNTSGGVRMVDATWQLQKDCAEALVALCDAARAAGHELYLKSGYRSYKTQDGMYKRRLEKNGYDDGWVAKPGTSDHQTGLGCDVVPKNWTDRGMNEDMAREEETQWMAAHCAEFGFILRYPQDKEDVTQINYEPWHLRYVGVEVATYIMGNGLCLEEFHVELQAAIDEFLAAGGPEHVVEDLIQASAEDQ